MYAPLGFSSPSSTIKKKIDRGRNNELTKEFYYFIVVYLSFSSHISPSLSSSHTMSSAQFLELNDVNEAPENKRDKKRRDLVEKLNKQSAEIYDRRDM